MLTHRRSYTAGNNFFGDNSPEALLREFGSPLYVYNEAMLRTRCEEMRSLIKHPSFTASYSTKANGNPHLLRIIRACGLHADAMSPGEVALVRQAGFTREETAYVCNNVAADELVLASRVASHVSVDSLSQLESFGRAVPGGRVMVRLNPGKGAGHHAKVITAGAGTKFGVSPEDFDAMRALLRTHNLTLAGLNQHVGSLFMEGTAYLEAAAWLLSVAEEFPGLEVVDFGGGFGIPYHKYEGQARLDLADLSERLTAMVTEWAARTGYKGRFFAEPGRYVTAECGLTLGTVNAVKNNGPTRYVGTDMGFSVLARPIMYDAFHDVEIYPADGVEAAPLAQTIVGNICETGDVLAKDRLLPEIRTGDIVGILDTGAYGHSMSSQYTQRLRPAEVLINLEGRAVLIRRRDTVADLLAVYS